MKAMKYLLVAAAMMAVAPASAQKAEDNPEVKAVIELIKTNKEEAVKQGQKLVKKNKKNPDVAYAIGSAFLKEKDFDNANIFADLAIKNAPKAAAGHLLAGDIAYEQNDGGVAAAEYEQAIYLEEMNEDAYYKYASIYKGKSPELAIEKLETLKSKRPDLEIDRKIAEVYYFSNEFDNAAQRYGSIDRSKLDEKDLTNYAMALFMKHDYDQSLSIAKEGLARNPKDAAFNRLALYNLTDMKQYDQALTYADALFNKSEDAKVSYMDKAYYGYALNGVKDYTGAITKFQEALNDPDVREDMKTPMMKTLADAYIENQQFDEAANTMKEYLDKLGSKKTIGDMYELENLYCTKAEKATDEAGQKAAMAEAEGVYNDIMTVDGAQKLYQPVILLARTWSNLDAETTKGWAKPWYEKTASLLEGIGDAKYNKQLIECYRYLGYYYYIQTDPSAAKTADGYWKKILQLDPENEVAKKALGIK